MGDFRLRRQVLDRAWVAPDDVRSKRNHRFPDDHTDRADVYSLMLEEGRLSRNLVSACRRRGSRGGRCKHSRPGRWRHVLVTYDRIAGEDGIKSTSTVSCSLLRSWSTT